MKTPHSAVARLAIAIALCLGGTAIAAEYHVTYLDKPAGPRSLPGDNLPPFGMLDDTGKLTWTREPPAGVVHGDKRESDAPGPPLEVAMAGAMAAVDECRRLGAYGAATVVDAAGDARAMLTADGADGSHGFVAQRKAITALAFDRPSLEVKALAKKGDPETLERIRPNMFVQFGAYPIKARGKVIGAIGYSGGFDEPCALAGLKAIEARLPR